jgi:hypothetical protein
MTCKLGAFIAGLPDEAGGALTDALATPSRYSADRIVTVLRAPDAPAHEQLRVSASQIRTHRRRQCACYLGSET